MDEGLGPQPLAPLYSKGMSQCFLGKLEPHRTSMFVYGLQVPELMKEHVIEHEATNRYRRPFVPSSSAELLRWLAASFQAHARRQRTKSDIPTLTVDIAKNAGTAAAIIEVDSTQLLPEFDRHAAQNNADVLLVHVVDSISIGNGPRKLDLRSHTIPLTNKSNTSS